MLTKGFAQTLFHLQKVADGTVVQVVSHHSSISRMLYLSDGDLRVRVFCETLPLPPVNSLISLDPSSITCTGFARFSLNQFVVIQKELLLSLMTFHSLML